MRTLRNFLTGVYVLLLIPAGFLGATASADYRYLACPGANQCTDALTVWKAAAIFGFVGLIIVGMLWLAVAASDREDTCDA